jgi:hypothetical protein
MLCFSPKQQSKTNLESDQKINGDFILDTCTVTEDRDMKVEI